MNISEQVQTNWMKLIMADGFGLPLVAIGFKLPNLFTQIKQLMMCVRPAILTVFKLVMSQCKQRA